eukprot:g25496.t1
MVIITLWKSSVGFARWHMLHVSLDACRRQVKHCRFAAASSWASCALGKACSTLCKWHAMHLNFAPAATLRLVVASEAGELKAQAGACLNLGILYNSRGNHEKSVELLEQHFDLARQIGDRKLIDSARTMSEIGVVLGMVRGNGKLKAYINMVNHDLDKLLKWKSKRATLDS